MSDARAALLERVIADVAEHGLADRSLRDIADSTGTSHRMLNYHFGSRAALIEAIVAATEQQQHQTMLRLAGEADSGADLILALWREVSSEELRPFVRLFFECVGLTGGHGLTEPWLDVAESVAERVGERYDPELTRVGVAVSRGLLIDVLATGSTADADRAMERFVELWSERASA